MSVGLLFTLALIVFLYTWPLIIGIGAYFATGRSSAKFALIQIGWAIIIMLITVVLWWASEWAVFVWAENLVQETGCYKRSVACPEVLWLEDSVYSYGWLVSQLAGFSTSLLKTVRAVKTFNKHRLLGRPYRPPQL